MTRATNAGGSLSSAGYVPASRRAPVDPGLILRMKDRGLGAQNIALQTGYSMEDVRRVLAPATVSNPATPKARPAPTPARPTTGGTPPRELTERDHFILAMVEKGEVSQYAAARLLNCTAKTVRRYLDRRADAASEQKWDAPVASIGCSA
jgi:hypothetical protein